MHCSAYDKAAIKMRGSRAALNFPGTNYSNDSFMKVLARSSVLLLVTIIIIIVIIIIIISPLIEGSAELVHSNQSLHYDRLHHAAVDTMCTFAEVWTSGQDAVHHEAQGMGSGDALLLYASLAEADRCLMSCFLCKQRAGLQVVRQSSLSLLVRMEVLSASVLVWRVQAVETEGPSGTRSHADEDLPPYAPAYGHRDHDVSPER